MLRRNPFTTRVIGSTSTTTLALLLPSLHAATIRHRGSSSSNTAAAEAAIAADKRKAQEELTAKRVDRFREDMYRMPVFSPIVLLFTMIGLAGFLVTWGYNVATPVYLAYSGSSGESEGGDNADLD